MFEICNCFSLETQTLRFYIKHDHKLLTMTGRVLEQLLTTIVSRIDKCIALY